MSNKFESLLELLINEENDKAEALFHEIVVEKSRDIYENLADGEVKAEAKEKETTEAKDEAKEDDKKEEVKETEKSDEKKDEKEVDETKSTETKNKEAEGEDVQVKNEAIPQLAPQVAPRKTDEESIEEIGGDATDELIKDISADEEGEGDKAADELGQDMDADAENGENGEEGSVEDRVVDLEDALDELKAEFEAMMTDKNGDEDEAEAEETAIAPVIPAQETQPEMSRFEAKAKEDKKDVVKEYKIQKSADNAEKADHKTSPVAKTGGAKQGGTPVKTGSGAEDKGRPAPTAQKVKGEFANSPGKDKSTSYKKEVKADTKDGSDKSGKSVISGK